MIRLLAALAAACLAASCMVTAPIRAAADVTGDVARGAVGAVTPGGDDKD